MNFKTHKDKLPQNTINEIRNILSDLGFFVYESEWHSFTDNCHSVRLGNDELQCFTNGKGISKQYALASAYAEFMERLQGNLLISKNYGIMNKEDFSYPDDIEMILGSYAKKNRIVIENIMDPSIVDQHHDFKIK